MRLAFVVALCLSFACTRDRTADAQAGAGDSELWSERFPAFKGATLAGKEHVSGANMHIICSAYTTSARPEDVVAFYASRYPDAKPESARSITVRGTNEHVLSVSAIEERGTARCGAKMKGGERTIIVVSQAVR